MKLHGFSGGIRIKNQLCIIIHGFTGNPLEVESLANALKQIGYEVITPLLPGHSMEKKRMEKVAASVWIEMIEQIVKEAKKEHKQIHMIGFSMGAMLASLMTFRYQVSTLVLLSPSLFVVTPQVLIGRIKNFLQLRKVNHSSFGQAILSNLSSMQSAPMYNVFQFRKIVREAKKIFQHISVPTCIIHGQKDELVDPSSSDWIYRILPAKEKELHYLPNSKHLICLGCESETVNQTVIQFLEKYI